MRSSRESLQQRIDALPLHRRAWLTWKLYRDPHVSPILKRTITIGALAYIASPIDILPDLLLGVGQVDDLGILAGTVFMLSTLLVKFAPEEVLLDYLDGTYNAHTMEDRRATRSPDVEGDIDVPFRVR